jgi:uncharacterized membrane protein
MELSLDLNQLLVQPLTDMLKGIIAFIPNVISSVLTIVIGVLVAVIARKIVQLFLKSIGFDDFSAKIGLSPESSEEGARQTAPHQYVALVVYWIVIFTAIILALHDLKLHGASIEANAVFDYALTILTVTVLAIVGLVLSMLVYRVVKKAATSVGYERPDVIAAVGKWVVLSFVFLICLFRIGVPEELLLGFLGITYITLCITFIIAFGIGGAGYASDVLRKVLKYPEKSE